MKTRLLAVTLALVCANVLAHGTNHPSYELEQTDWGMGATARDATRTIEIDMDDNMRFSREHIAVKLGETIKFVVRNKGGVMHEMVLGTQAELDRHAMLMEQLPHMAHDQPWMTHVQPKKTGTLYWTFNRPGEFAFACLISGHYAAGMKGKITVAAMPSDWVNATVSAINYKTRRITLAHDAINTLGFPAAKTEFDLGAGARGARIAVGDKVKFIAEKSGYRRVVLALERVE